MPNAALMDEGRRIALSIVIPVHNEAANIQPLYAELRTVVTALATKRREHSTFNIQLPTSKLTQDHGSRATDHGRDIVEIIFVDDGSRDGTWEEIVEVLKLDSRVHATRMRCRRGKAGALAVGFQLATGDYIVTLDGDLQDDPQEIARLLEMAEGGYDVVCGWKQQRCDPWPTVLGSRVFNRVIGWACGLKLHDHNCGLKLLKAEVAREIRLFGELHRFITLLAHSKGFRVTEIPVHHRPRRHGRSKYGAFKAIEGLLDLLVVRVLTIFLEKPFHLLGTLGFGISSLGFAGLAYLAFYWLLGLGSIGGRPLLIYSTVALLFGMQLLALGITAELINWRLTERHERPVRKFSGENFRESRDSREPEGIVELRINSSHQE